MPESLTAIFHTETVCIFELLDENEQYIEEVRSKYRRASQANELFCPECHGGMELCAGAIVKPYFRHKSLNDCPISRELKTEAGKRMYQGKKMLYSLGKTLEAGEVSIEESSKELPYRPVLIHAEEKEMAFLYLDGKSRNYQELTGTQSVYEEKKIVPYWFLHKKYQSHGKNLTSDEAEVSQLNHGILYYLDTENQTMDFRKSYQTPFGERKYFTQSVPLKELVIDSLGEFNSEFLIEYHELVEKEKQKIDRVLRVPIEDGLEECYFEFSYLYLDVIDEIWVLPKLRQPLEDQEYNILAEQRRKAYAEQYYHMACELGPYDRDRELSDLLEYLNQRKQVSNWIN